MKTQNIAVTDIHGVELQAQLIVCDVCGQEKMPHL